VLSRQERINYHDPAVNRAAVAGYVDRLLAAEALVLCFPVWNFGLPALLKGFFDRVFLPGVSFDLSADGRIAPRLLHIRKIAAIATYGRPRPVAWYMGDPPRRFCTRGLRRLIRPGARVVYRAHYRMNVSTEATRALSRQGRARHGAVLSRVARGPRCRIVAALCGATHAAPAVLWTVPIGLHRDPCGKHA
jgi:NAD(P)H dehydrogenase (quinone)